MKKVDPSDPEMLLTFHERINAVRNLMLADYGVEAETFEEGLLAMVLSSMIQRGLDFEAIMNHVSQMTRLIAAVRGGEITLAPGGSVTVRNITPQQVADAAEAFSELSPDPIEWIGSDGEPLNEATGIMADGANKGEPICNLCGLSCLLGRPGREERQAGGLIDIRVIGHYDSTPGNGSGALGDLQGYAFSLCEFCLDHVFQRFRVPPRLLDPLSGNVVGSEETMDEAMERTGGFVMLSPRPEVNPEPWRSATTCVLADTWRTFKGEYFAEAERRRAARLGLAEDPAFPAAYGRAFEHTEERLRALVWAVAAPDPSSGLHHCRVCGERWKQYSESRHAEDCPARAVPVTETVEPRVTQRDWRAVAEALMVAQETGENLASIRARFGLDAADEKGGGA